MTTRQLRRLTERQAVVWTTPRLRYPDPRPQWPILVFALATAALLAWLTR